MLLVQSAVWAAGLVSIGGSGGSGVGSQSASPCPVAEPSPSSPGHMTDSQGTTFRRPASSRETVDL